MNTKTYIENIIGIQKEYFSSGITFDPDFRIRQLIKLKKMIKGNEKKIFESLAKDLGKPHFEAYTSEIMPIKTEISLAISNLKKWCKPKKIKTPLALFPGKSRIYPEPYGLVLNIAPWNYPFQLCISPLIPILAAGNCAVIKPSEYAPHTSKLTAQLISECFPLEYCAVAEGGVPETKILLNQKWDYIMFTGNPTIGKIVAKAAAENLTPTLLELGGKSPCIVHNDADIKTTARRIVWGKFYNVGQTCTAPDFVAAHCDISKPLKEAIINEIKNFYSESAIKSTDYCRIINRKHFDRLTQYLDDDKIIYGGKTDSEKLFIEPTIFSDISFSHPLMQDEIFGPLLPIIEYSELDNLIHSIKKMERPLALYLYTKNKKIQKKIIRNIQYGGGCVNTCLMHSSNPHLPFGGIGNSGMGAYHGKTGFDTFTHYKSIFFRPTCIDPNLIYPPYGNKLKIVKKLG